MGAQDSKETWAELPFWRLMKYYFLIGLASSIATFALTLFGLVFSYPILAPMITTSLIVFATSNWLWLLAASAILSIIPITKILTWKHKRKTVKNEKDKLSSQTKNEMF